MFTQMSPFNLLMFITMIMSSLMALSSNNWLLTWVALEINMLSFIPLINNSNKFQESEAMVKYFLAQALGSSIFLLASSTLWMSMSINKNTFVIMLMISLVIKLGMVPCHMWFPAVMTSMSWISCLILSTWQKLAPMTILVFMLKINSVLMFIVPSINALTGAMMGMNQTKLKSIMAFSSITHMGWMTSLMIPFKPLISVLYLFMYSIIILPIFIMFYLYSMYSVQTKTPLNPPLSTMSMSVMLMSLSGVPPLIGFIPKWMTISMMINFPSTVIVLIMGAMMNMYFYLNIIFSSLLNITHNSKFVYKNSPFMFVMVTSTLPLMLIMFMYAMTMLN